MVSVAKLLSTCIDANRQGCEVIRDFRNANVGPHVGTLKEAGDVKSVVTQADLDAQRVIVSGLRRAWGDGLRIVGEEDDDDDDDDDTATAIPTDLRTDLLPESLTLDVPLDELTVFVDPLDGTREFVEGRVEHVGCLIGIARNGRTVGGAVGVPFGDAVHYALLPGDADALSGTYPTAAVTDNDARPTVLTGDSSDPILLRATQRALDIIDDSSPTTDPKARHVIKGGCTAKLLAVAHSLNAVAVLHFKTCLWDTCAPEAILNARGGKLTDLFGAPLVHAADTDGGVDNKFGVVASSAGMGNVHDELCEQMRADFEALHTVFGGHMGGTKPQCPQAVDIARDLDGAPLDKHWLEQQILGSRTSSEHRLLGYTVPDSGTARNMMSNGCRILLDWDTSVTTTSPPPPSSVFYKRVVMADSADSLFKLRYNTPKLLRDVKSYQVETAFLTSDACRGLVEEAGVLINRVYASDLRPDYGPAPVNQIQSKFALLVEDLSRDGWRQEWLLEERSARASLAALAGLHGYCWRGSDFWRKKDGQAGRDLERAVWSNGGYMQPALQGTEQLESVADGWTKRLPSFEEALRDVPQLKNVDLVGLGQRLQNVAKIVGERAHPFWSEETGSRDAMTADNDDDDNPLWKYRTLIHGDPKQANIFLREKNNDDDTATTEAALIDFQWAGFGLAATDVAHFVCAALQPDCLSYDGEDRPLLDHYHSHLARALVNHGVATSLQDVEERVYPRAVLQDQYETALLDICRLVFAYAWKRWKPETEPTPESLNRNSYNKSLPNVLWLVTRCSQVLDKWEGRLLQ